MESKEQKIEPSLKKITIQLAKRGFTQALNKSLEKGEITQLEYAQYIRYKFNKDKCILSGYKPNKPAPNDYTQVRVDGVKYYCHRIAASVHLDHDFHENCQASHTCNQARCYNPLHIVTSDPDDVNRSRMCCRLFKNLLHYRCPHTPTCEGLTAVHNYDTIKQ
jgi:hypothetical protein